MQNDSVLLRYAAEDLISFCYVNNPKYVCADHHETIANALERTLYEDNLRIILTAPPRHGKSHLVSENYPAWYLGNRPDCSMMLCSYGQELANEFGQNVRNIVAGDNYGQIFPGITLSQDSKAKKRFNTNKGGTYIAVGRGGSITGKGGKILIIDDLCKDDKEAESDLISKQNIQWFKSTLYTRLAPGGSVIVMATRWSQKDIIQFLIDDHSEKWEVINLPAITLEYEDQAYEEGVALWPERFSIDDLLRIKRTLGTRNFEALYQQSPRPAEGALIKRSWLKFYNEMPRLDKMILIQSWDMAFKGSEDSDFVVGQVWGVYRGNLYLIDEVREHMDFPATIRAVLNMTSKYPGAVGKLIEVKANGQAVVDTLKLKITGIIEVCPDESKETRVNSVAPLYEAGNIHYPSPSIAPWIEGHVEEIVAFPFGKNDDRVDAESQALKKLAEHCNSDRYYDNLVEGIYI